MKQIKLQIEIEIDSPKLGKVTSRITDYLFPSYSTGLDAEYFTYKVKNCLAKFDGFDMLTIDMMEAEEGMYNNYTVTNSRRWTTKPQLQTARLHPNNKYEDWTENTSIKQIYAQIKYFVERANSEFLENFRKAALNQIK